MEKFKLNRFQVAIRGLRVRAKGGVELIRIYAIDVVTDRLLAYYVAMKSPLR
jgi:hypothetical protein